MLLMDQLKPNPLDDSPAPQPLSHSCFLTPEYKINGNNFLPYKQSKPLMVPY